MKQAWAILAVIGLLVLLVGGCGNDGTVVSSTPESEGTKTAVKTYFDPLPTPFTVGATVRVRDEVFAEDFRGKIITSKTQLDALNLSDDYDTVKYTDNYFENKALVVTEIKLVSGSIQIRVNTIIVKHEIMTVYYHTAYTEPFTQDIAYWRILLEVDKNDVDSVCAIKGIRSGGFAPSATPITTTKTP